MAAMPAPAEIRQLVERFEANLDSYRGGAYNETLLRRDFLDPFFKALGWDIDNSEGYAEAFREVVHEDDVLKNALLNLPIRNIYLSDKTDRARHDRMVALVEQMLKLHESLAAAKTGHDKTLLERQIAATERQIDALVYELYGLTDDEIAIVEGAGSR